MTSPRPPRLALALLERFVPDSSPLAGDLLEECCRGRGRAWVWWQVLAAIAVAQMNGPDEIRPLRLVELQPTDAQERSRRLNLRFAAVNLSASPTPAVGGLGLMVLGMLITIVVPFVWWLLIGSIAAGVGFGAAKIAMRARPNSADGGAVAGTTVRSSPRR